MTTTARSRLPEFRLLLPGVYAWGMTLWAPLVAAQSHWAARACAALALVGIAVGAFVVHGAPTPARFIGVHGVLACATAAWLTSSSLVSPERLEPMSATLGSVGWALYAVGWGARHVEPARADDRSPLEPRARLAAGATWIVAAAAMGALVLVALAFRETRAEHALFAHAAALLAGAGVLLTGATVAVERGRVGERGPAAQRLAGGLRWLIPALLVALAVWVLSAWLSELPRAAHESASRFASVTPRAEVPEGA